MTINMTQIVETFLLITFPIAVFIFLSGESQAQDRTLTIPDTVAIESQLQSTLDEKTALFLISKFDQQRFQAMIPLVSETYSQEALVAAPIQHMLQFGSQQHTVNLKDRQVLQHHAEFLAVNPNLFLIVSGHSAREGSETFNTSISEKRANTVANLLLHYGAPAEQLLVGYYGDKVLLSVKPTHKDNRRVELEYLQRLHNNSETINL